jgi:hypothetical protein
LQLRPKTQSKRKKKKNRCRQFTIIKGKLHINYKREESTGNPVEMKPEIQRWDSLTGGMANPLVSCWQSLAMQSPSPLFDNSSFGHLSCPVAVPLFQQITDNLRFSRRWDSGSDFLDINNVL